MVNYSLKRRAFLTSAFAAALVLAVADRAFAQVMDVTAQQAATLLQSDPQIVVLDIRTRGEFARGHIEGAVNMNFYGRDFRQRVSQLDPSKTYLVHCAVGGRSHTSMRILQSAGLQRIVHLPGGIYEWQREGLPMVRP